MEQHTAHNGADIITKLLQAHVSDSASDIDVHEAIAVRDDLRELAERSPESGGEICHSFEVGEYAIDDTEPTASPEVNTVEIVELIDKRANEHVIEETGKTVAEHNEWYPEDDPVVKGVYPHMSSDKVWHFPESRLRPV